MRGDAPHKEEGVPLPAGRQRRRRSTRASHELGEASPPAELDAPEDAARHASWDCPRRPLSSSPDSSSSGLGSDYERVCRRLPNANKHKIYLGVYQLSSRN